jgi:hypothetical protein
VRYEIRFILVLVLGVMGCGGTSGSGGSGGSGGSDLCADVACDDDLNECTGDGVCDPMDGMCDYPSVEDGTECADGAGACEAGSCAGTFACTEQGIRDAIAVGGGPHTFDCDGPTAVMSEAEIAIENEVVLDGEGKLTVDGSERHRLFSVAEGIKAELRGFGITNGYSRIYAGGIWNTGTLTLVESTVSGSSTSHGDAGGIYSTGTLTLLNSTVSENDGGSGGIRNEGTLTLTNSTVSGNFNGGISNNGTLTLTHSTVSENLGGGIISWRTVTLANSVVSGNVGGGISSLGTLTLTHSEVSGNSRARGGGIWNDGVATVTDSSISANTASPWGAAGIYNGGTLTLTNSTVSANAADDAYGGGIFNVGTLTLLNSTVSANRASEGGGIWNLGTLTLVDVTVSGNARGGIAAYDRDGCFPECRLPLMMLVGTIMDDECILCRIVEDISDCDGLAVRGGKVESGGYNVESDGNTCGFDQATDQVHVAAEALTLGPLQDNGGPTDTHALGAGSVANDVIPEVDCVDVDGAPLTTDQRGEPRPGGTMCDVGAFEVQP